LGSSLETAQGARAKARRLAVPVWAWPTRSNARASSSDGSLLNRWMEWCQAARRTNSLTKVARCGRQGEAETGEAVFDLNVAWPDPMVLRGPSETIRRLWRLLLGCVSKGVQEGMQAKKWWCQAAVGLVASEEANAESSRTAEGCCHGKKIDEALGPGRSFNTAASDRQSLADST